MTSIYAIGILERRPTCMGSLKFFGDIKFWRVLICVGPSPSKPFFCQMFSACANKHPFV